MSIFTSLFKVFSPREKLGNHFIYSLSDLKDIYEADALRAYMKVPEVSSIINRDAAMFSNMRIIAVNKDGKEVEDKYITDLFSKPNWFQGGKEFIRQSRILRNIYGNEFIYFLRPVGIGKTKSMFTIPSSKIKIEYKGGAYFDYDDVPEQLTYSVEIDGKYYPIDKKDLLHINDNTVSIDKVNDPSFLKGGSKLRANAAPINNIMDAYESRGIIIRKRGALGILSNNSKDGIGSTMPIDDSEKKQVQDDYKNYGTLAGQNQLIITNASLTWQQMAQNEPKKLGLFDEVREDFMKLLDAFGHPLELYASQNGATFENQEQAIKNVYVNTIIPAANEWLQPINEMLTNGKGYNLVASYSHLPIFQEDLNEKGQQLKNYVNALSTALADGAIDINEYKIQIQKILE